jgi:hypothetical protein
MLPVQSSHPARLSAPRHDEESGRELEKGHHMHGREVSFEEIEAVRGYDLRPV